MTILCDLCLEPTPEPVLWACVEADHCAACVAACVHCQQAGVDEHAEQVAADLALTDCEATT